MKFPDELIIDEIKAKKIDRVRERQAKYFEFWKEKVAPLYLQHWERE